MTVVARALALLLLLAGLVAVPSAAEAARPPLPSESTWKADVRQAMAGSRVYLSARASEQQPDELLAINLDIDNTMIASGYDGGGPVRPTLAFAARADALGMSVFVNTARPNRRRAETLEQLAAAGYTVDRLCMRRAREKVRAGKVRCRTSFADLGYTLVANVGNNPTDFQGGGYEMAYRLPNYGGRLS